MNLRELITLKEITKVTIEIYNYTGVESEHKCVIIYA